MFLLVSAASATSGDLQKAAWLKKAHGLRFGEIDDMTLKLLLGSVRSRDSGSGDDDDYERKETEIDYESHFDEDDDDTDEDECDEDSLLYALNLKYLEIPALGTALDLAPTAPALAGALTTPDAPMYKRADVPVSRALLQRLVTQCWRLGVRLKVGCVEMDASSLLPQSKLDLCGTPLSSSEVILLAALLPGMCMRRLEVLVLDSCGLGVEAMALLLPAVNDVLAMGPGACNLMLLSMNDNPFIGPLASRLRAHREGPGEEKSGEREQGEAVEVFTGRAGDVGDGSEEGDLAAVEKHLLCLFRLLEWHATRGDGVSLFGRLNTRSLHLEAYGEDAYSGPLHLKLTHPVRAVI
jgi:hypothetical protein